MNITTIGLDLAKSVFHVVCYNSQFKEVKKRMLRRNQVLQFFTQLAPCLIGMEACASASYWGRELRSMGHDVKLIPPQHVKPYLRGNKNDYNDARAIAEATTRPGMPTVAIKTTEEQDIQALHRMRSQCLRDRTALCNSTRGLLGEYGIILPKGITVLRRSIPDLLEDADNSLSDFFRELLARRYKQLVELDEHISFYTINSNTRADRTRLASACRRFQGLGPSLPALSAVLLVMDLLTSEAEMFRPPWGWFPVSIVVVVKMSYLASANVETAMYAVSWFTVHVLLSHRRSERMTLSVGGLTGFARNAAGTRPLLQ